MTANGSSSESGDAGLRAAEDQRVDVVRALVGIHGFEVQHVPDHVELVDDAIPAVHVSRDARDIERLAATVALHDRRDFGRGAMFVLQPSETQATLKAERDLRLHVRELLLHKLIRGERAAELLAVHHVLARRLPAEFRRAERAPGDTVARAVEAT